MKHAHKTSDSLVQHGLKHIGQYTLACIVAGFLSIGLVMTMQHVDTRSLVADVANVGVNPPSYNADLILSGSVNGQMSLIFGSTATDVDMMHFVVLGDPSHFHGLTAHDPRIQVQNTASGVYAITIPVAAKNINPGTIIAHFQVDSDPGTMLAMTDTDFVSGDAQYSLTNTVQ